MPWAPFIVITVFFGVICGNRLLDNHFRRPYAAIKSLGTTVVAESTNTKYYSKALKDSLVSAEVHACRHFYGLDRKCVHNRRRIINEHLDLDRFNADANTNAKRFFDDANSHDLSESSIALSDILPVDALPTRSTIDNLPVDNVNTVDMGVYMQPPLPTAYYTESYEDLMGDANKEDVKRAGTNSVIGCDCKIKNDIIDLGQQHFPRYLLNSVCQNDKSPKEYPQKCWRGSYCKPLEYKVKVLTFRAAKDPNLAWLPDVLRPLWKFTTVTVAAGCFCSY